MLGIVVRNALQILRDRKGVTAAEYAVLAVGIIGVVTAAVAAFGTALTTRFSTIFGTTP
jgi:pilus assembly protein Flp/PilA